jgi:hypothetical protein
MKIISVHSATDSLQGSTAGTKLTGTIGRDGLSLQLETTDTHPVSFAVRFAGAVLTPVDAERDVGKAAVGAIAGGLLLGPLGALAGGAMSGGRKHTLVLKSPDARVVFEASTKELQELAGLGLPAAGDIAVETKALPKGKKMNLFWGYATLVVIFGLMVKCAVGKSDTPPPSSVPASAAAQQAPQQAAAASVAATGTPKKAPASKTVSKTPVGAPAKKPTKPESFKAVRVAADTGAASR